MDKENQNSFTNLQLILLCGSRVMHKKLHSDHIKYKFDNVTNILMVLLSAYFGMSCLLFSRIN